jgi:ABC-type iron transport system FetAB permease component
LAKRFVRRDTSPVEAANLLRRVITVGCTLNLLGLLVSLLGAQYIVGTLVAKAMQNVVGYGNMAISSQVLQPLDVLVVQANTNVLTSHFVSLGCLLWLTRMVDVLDPPSLEEDI